jgi:hypothetical protein
MASGKPKPFPWVEVGGKPSYAEMVKSSAKALTGANKLPLGSHAARLSSGKAVRHPGGRHIALGNKQAEFNRRSVFDRIIFPRRSVFDRISWNDSKFDKRTGVNINHDHSVHQEKQPQVRLQSSPVLDLNLNLGQCSFEPQEQRTKTVSNKRPITLPKCKMGLQQNTYSLQQSTYTRDPF